MAKIVMNGKVPVGLRSKKRMRQFGKVEIPQKAFIAALKMDEN